MSRLCRYVGVLAGLVTVLALVGCGGGPGAQPEAKRDREQSVSAGRDGLHDSLFPISSTGRTSTYSATTSNRAVATVTVDNDRRTPSP